MAARSAGATLQGMQLESQSREPDKPGETGDAYSDLDEMYRDNVARIYRLMYAKVGNRCDAEDLTSSVFLAALPRLRSTACRGEVRAYLAATCRTTLAGHWRGRVGREVTTLEVADAVQLLGDPVGGSDEPVRSRRVLDALPHRHRRILELRFLEALSIKDAARRMGVSVGNAKVLQHRALARAAVTAGAS
jgi:RNA polymerase sigma-70 factor (ECF subfamily)